MKKVLNLGVCYLLSTFMILACSSEDICEQPQKTLEEGKPNTCRLILNVDKPHYADEISTRTADTWKDGDKVYLTFTTKTGQTYGDAIFKEGSWTVNYYGALTEGEQSACYAVYFENPQYASSSVVQINEETAVYEDLKGTYVYSGGSISVTANLVPKTGRIRFEGNDKDSITVYGIKRFTSYDVSTGKYTTSIGAIRTGVASQYTPYIYGVFADEDTPRLNIITKTSGFTRVLSNTIYQPGESGYMSIPSEASHNGWLQSVVLEVNDVEFTMIPVEYSGGFFLLAETETTEQLYNAVTGGTATNSTYPKSSISYNTWTTFISKMKTVTELNFYIPSSAEWQHAFKGGNKSQGYLYSGSNIISNVAWYTGNSNGVKQMVKQLQPNELGFYDMSGNVWEFSSTIRSGYSSYHMYYGGGSNSNESSCTITASNYTDDTTFSSSIGLRVALKP